MADPVSTALRGARKAKRAVSHAANVWFSLRHRYAWHYKHSPIDEKAILFESFHGKTVSDSPLYMAREFLSSARSEGFKVYYATMKSNLEAHTRLVKSLGLDVTLVPIESPKYVQVLATAKYLVNNSSFPAYFTRRPEQRYIQTWHGTPLKTLGKRMREGIESMYNVQHNFLQANMLIFPNEFTRDVLMRDYNLTDLYTGDIALLGYPRNQVFFDTERAEAIKADYHLDEFETFAYMPTWRGASNYAVDIAGYRTQVMKFLQHLDSTMRDDQLMFVNFHSMLAGKITLDEFDHILPFPADADNYEFLNALDVLITDYSSVFFDYSLTRKPVILFDYDREEYLAERGMYLDIDDLPFPKISTIEELADIISTSSFKSFDYTGTPYERDFLPYDSAGNARNALDLLFEGQAEGIPVVSYAHNAQRHWSTVEPRIQKTTADLKTACEATDPDNEIVIFRKSDFGPVKSQMLHDNYQDSFNFIFITKAHNCTAVEELLRQHVPRIQAAVDERERQRILPGLDVPKIPETETYTPAVNSNFILRREDLDTVKASVKLQGRSLKIKASFADLEAKGLKPASIVIAQGRLILRTRKLKPEEIESGHINMSLKPLFLDDVIAAESMLELLVDVEEIATAKHRLIAFKLGGDREWLPEDRMNAAIGISILRPKEEDGEDTIIFGERVDMIRDRIAQTDSTPAIAVFKNKHGGLSMYTGFRHDLLTSLKWASLDSISSAHGNVRIKARMHEGNFIVEDLVIRLRSATNPVEIGIPYSLTHEKDGMLAFEAEFDPKALPLQEIYWDCFIVIRMMGTRGLIPIRTNGLQQFRLRVGNQQWRLPDDKVLFTHIAKANALAFVYRDYYPEYDTMAFRAKEFAALGTFAILHPYWKRKRVWLVYEKFCKLAQDNGFYFFEYCMSLPESQRKHIYYIIDKSQPDYANVAPYDAQVIDFGSFKHLLYNLVSKIYVASDSQSHLYIWRPKPSYLRMRIRKHKILFLQHGVTALKRDDELFGKKGSSPMTYYLTTSKNEQDVIVQNFGYTPRQAPILGFSRWDVLKDCSSADEPTILLMPTWRPWLEEQDDETFRESDYFKAYSSLIESTALAQVLERRNMRLRFFIHPKLSSQLKNFDAISERVELVPQGSEQLNFAMMKCNMLITDYSSVCWDVLYMEKPVVFYQFDQELYNRVTGSYIDLNSELPGDVCITEEETIAAIEACAERGFKLTEEHAEIAKSWYAYKDTDNRERTLNFILNKGL